ncbi:CPBP family glutamic-type intramembrane protease [Enterococcus sp. LJL128]
MNHKRSISHFLAFTFTLSWSLWGGAIFLTQCLHMPFQHPIVMILFIFGGISPAISELIMHKKSSSKDEWQQFLGNILNFRHSVSIYLVIILLAFSFAFLPVLLGGAVQKLPIYLAFLEFPIMIIGGGIEEIGWRGFLQPALQKKYSVFASDTIVAVIWTLWHVPLWFIAGSNQSTMNFLYFSVACLSLSYLLGGLYNYTNSIYLCIVFHALINAFWDVYVLNGQMFSAFVLLIVSIAFALFLKKTREQQVHSKKQEQKADI